MAARAGTAVTHSVALVALTWGARRVYYPTVAVESVGPLASFSGRQSAVSRCSTTSSLRTHNQAVREVTFPLLKSEGLLGVIDSLTKSPQQLLSAVENNRSAGKESTHTQNRRRRHRTENMTRCVSMCLVAMAAAPLTKAFVAPGNSLSVSALGREGITRSCSKVSRVAASFSPDAPSAWYPCFRRVREQASRRQRGHAVCLFIVRLWRAAIQTCERDAVIPATAATSASLLCC